MKINIRVLLDTTFGLIECPWAEVDVDENSNNVTIVQAVKLDTSEPPKRLPERKGTRWRLR